MSTRDTKALSRRRLLLASGLGVAGGALALSGRAQAQEPFTGTGGRAASPKHLPPGRPGKDYQPVVVPNGAKLPWKVVDGVKVFHLVAEEVDHEFAPGLEAACWGYNGRVHGPTHRGGRGRPRAHLRHQPAARRRPRCTGTAPAAQRHGRRRRPQPAGDRPGRDVQVRVHAPAARHAHVPLAPRRDDPDGAGHGGHVHHPPAPAASPQRGPRLRADAARVADRPRRPTGRTRTR